MQVKRRVPHEHVNGLIIQLQHGHFEFIVNWGIETNCNAPVFFAIKHVSDKIPKSAFFCTKAFFNPENPQNHVEYRYSGRTENYTIIQLI